MDKAATFIYQVIRASTPYVYIALAAVISQQAGLLNMAIESMMLVSALVGVIVSGITQNLWLALACGIASSVIIALILCWASFVMKVDLYLMSISMNTAMAGGTVFVMYMTTGVKSNTAQHFASLAIPEVELPLIKDIPYIGQMLSGHNAMTYIMFVLIFFVWFLIYKTKLGLRFRAIGQNPQAAESVGISVPRNYTLAFCIASVIASLGGMYLSMGYVRWFSRNMVGGRGFIGMSAATVANASPGGSALAASVFGLSYTFTNYLKLTALDANFLAALPYLITVLLITVFSWGRMKAQKDHVKKVMQTAHENRNS